MAFLSFLSRKAPEKKGAALTTKDLALLLAGSSASSGVAVSPLRAMQQASVWACVRLLAETIAQLPIHTYQKTKGGSKQRVTSVTVAEALSHLPNTWQTGFEYFEFLVTALCLDGNHYAFNNRNPRTGETTELLPFLPSQVSVKRNGWDLRYKVTTDDISETFTAEQIHHVRGLSLNGYTGVSPITYHKETIGLAIAAEQHGGRLFKNKAMPAGVLKFLGKLTDEAYDRIKASWAATHGNEGVGGTAILEEGAEFQTISMNNVDAQYLELRGFQRKEICGIYRVPPHMVSDLDKSSFSNITQQSLEFAKFTILPWCRRIEAAISRDLLTPRQRAAGLYVEFLLSGLERADLEQRMRSYNIGIMSGMYSPNDCLAKENENPRPGGDIYVMPMNMADTSKGSLPQKSITSTREQKSAPKFTKGAAARETLRRQYLPKFQSLSSGLVGYETNKVRQILEQSITPGETIDMLRELYRDMPAQVKDRFSRLCREYALQVRLLALDEIASDHQIDLEELTDYIDQVIGTMADRHSYSSENQLLALITQAGEEEFSDLIEQRLQEWEDRRPAKIADRETIQQESALSRWVWAAAGIAQLQWVNRGSKSCPFCQELDGKIVGIEAPFIEEGNYEPPGHEDSPWKVRGPKMHAPLHQGCQCIILPV